MSLGDSDSMPNFVRRAFSSSCGDFLELVLGEEVVEDALAPQLEVQEVQEARLAEVLVLGEQVVEDAQGRLQIKVDNVFRSGLIKIIY